MGNLQKKGDRAERWALQKYRSKGFIALALKYRCTGGEIDLIVMKNSTIAFVEVKYRVNWPPDPEQLILHHKRQALKKAARHYLNNHQTEIQDLRFDLVICGPQDQYYYFPSFIEDFEWN